MATITHQPASASLETKTSYKQLGLGLHGPNWISDFQKGFICAMREFYTLWISISKKSGILY